MTDGAKPKNSYERKLQLILGLALRKFNGDYTPEQYALEHQVAVSYLAALGVKP